MLRQKGETFRHEKNNLRESLLTGSNFKVPVCCKVTGIYSRAESGCSRDTVSL